MKVTVNAPVSYVVHIGIGRGAEVAAYEAAGLAPIVLVDADQEAIADLRPQALQNDNIQLLNAAVSASADSHSLYHMNFAELSSLRKPTGLKVLFPGLEVVREERVAPVAPDVLIDQLSLPEDGQGLLVLEAPGEGLDILKSLEEAGVLRHFSAVRVQEGLDSLYEGAASFDEIISWLAEQGFVGGVDDASNDPDRPVFSAQRSVALVSKYLDLTEALATQVDLLDRAERQQKEAATQLSTEQDRAEAAETALQDSAVAVDELTQKLAEAKASAAKLEAMETRAKTAEGAFNQRDAALKESQAETKQLAQKLADAEDRASRFEALAKRAGTAEKTLSQCELALKDSEAAAKALQEQVNALTVDVEAGVRKLEAMETRAKTAEGAWKQRDGALKESQAEAKQLAQKLTDAETRVSKLEGLAKRAETAEATLNQREEALKDSQTAGEQLTKQLDALKAELTEREAKLGAMETRAKTAEGAFNQRDAALKESQAMAETLRTETSKAQLQLDEQKSRMLSVRQEINRAEGQLELITDLLLRDGGL